MRWVDQHLNWWGRLPVPSGGGSAGAGGGYPGFAPRPLGVLALLGAGAGVLFSRRRLQCLVLLLPLMLYLFGSYAVGDALRRYLQPVEWIGFVFIGVLFDLVLQAGTAGTARCRRWLNP